MYYKVDLPEAVFSHSYLVNSCYLVISSDLDREIFSTITKLGKILDQCALTFNLQEMILSPPLCLCVYICKTYHNQTRENGRPICTNLSVDGGVTTSETIIFWNFGKF